jgi:hypothetical protein
VGAEYNGELFRCDPSSTPIDIGLDSGEPGVSQNDVSISDIGEEESQFYYGLSLRYCHVDVVFDEAFRVRGSVYVNDGSGFDQLFDWEFPFSCIIQMYEVFGGAAVQ